MPVRSMSKAQSCFQSLFGSNVRQLCQLGVLHLLNTLSHSAVITHTSVSTKAGSEYTCTDLCVLRSIPLGPERLLCFPQFCFLNACKDPLFHRGSYQPFQKDTSLLCPSLPLFLQLPTMSPSALAQISCLFLPPLQNNWFNSTAFQSATPTLVLR